MELKGNGDILYHDSLNENLPRNLGGKLSSFLNSSCEEEKLKNVTMFFESLNICREIEASLNFGWRKLKIKL